MKVMYIFLLFAILYTIMILSKQIECESFRDSFGRPSRYDLPYSKALEVNPMAQTAAIMYQLQTPRDCSIEKRNVYDNPAPTQDDIDRLYECLHSSYDRYLIRSLPFGAKGGF
jgi:hypothetical protein